MTAVPREHIGGGAKPTRLNGTLAAGAASLTVETGGLASWPDGSVGRIPVVLDEGLASEEHLYATAKSGDTLTGLVRGQDGTADQPHSGNASVVHGVFGVHVDRSNELLSLPVAKGDLLVATAATDWRRQAAGANGTVLVYDSTQPNGVRATASLDGLTLGSPAIGNFTNAQHDHLDADDGGLLTQAATHQAADTDAATTSLHHTLGAGANQATPGTHPAATATHGVTGAIVGTSDAQTLTNKTLVTPAIASFVNAQHSHADAASGGTVSTTLPASVVKGVTLNNLKVHIGTINFDLAGANSATIVVTFGTGISFTDIPSVQLTPLQGAAVRVAAQLTAVSTTGCTVLVYRPDNSTSTATGSVLMTVTGPHA